MIQSSLPAHLWAEAINTANYILNRCPKIHHNGRTAYESWKGYTPSVSHFQVFGQAALIRNKDVNKGKFESRAKMGVFVGYSEISKGYRIWLPNEGKIEIARDIKFADRMAYPKRKSNPEDSITLSTPKKSRTQRMQKRLQTKRSKIIAQTTKRLSPLEVVVDHGLYGLAIGGDPGRSTNLHEPPITPLILKF